MIFLCEKYIKCECFEFVFVNYEIIKVCKNIFCVLITGKILSDFS